MRDYRFSYHLPILKTSILKQQGRGINVSFNVFKLLSKKQRVSRIKCTLPVKCTLTRTPINVLLHAHNWPEIKPSKWTQTSNI